MNQECHDYIDIESALTREYRENHLYFMTKPPQPRLKRHNRTVTTKNQDPHAELAGDKLASLPALTVYYDGACPVCTREIAGYRRQPGADACAWVDASRCDESAFGAGLTREAALKRLHVRHADGRLDDGVLGFANLWMALPRMAWLGRLAAWAPVTWVLEAAYAVFLTIRQVWRPTVLTLPWPASVTADLRSDHAGEVGAVQIYRGVLAVSRDPAVRAFALHHLETEQQHLACIEGHLPAAARSRLLPAWRVAGWLTGALPALAGPRAVYATVAAVESFVDQHYAEQIGHIDRLLSEPAAQDTGGDTLAALADLRSDLQACRQDELRHREEALVAGVAVGPMVRVWAAAVGSGSAWAVALARRW